METLRSKLEAFHPKSEKELDGIFLDLAESFLYGGYISVKDCENAERYRIYLRTVEFYCHYDGKDVNSALPKDPIVYHRNGKYVSVKNEHEKESKEREVPYFPLMAFHAHASGYDITFENKELGLRASALIRAYEVYDVVSKQFLTYNTSRKKFVVCKTEKERVNHQSTYLYYFLNGFIGESVKWKDDIWKTENCKISTSQRQNVYLYKDKGEGQYDYDLDKDGKKQKDERKWRFTRTEDLPF